MRVNRKREVSIGSASKASQARSQNTTEKEQFTSIHGTLSFCIEINSEAFYPIEKKSLLGYFSPVELFGLISCKIVAFVVSYQTA